MNCHEIHEWLMPCLMGDLDPAKAEEVRAHIQTCTACQANVEDMQATMDFLNKGLADTSDVPLILPDKFIKKFQKRRWGRPWSATFKAEPRRWRFRILEWAAVAAILFVLAGLFLPNLARVRERGRRVKHQFSLYSIDEGSGSPVISRVEVVGRKFEHAEKTIADGTSEAEALTKQLAEMPKQVAAVAGEEGAASGVAGKTYAYGDSRSAFSDSIIIAGAPGRQNLNGENAAQAPSASAPSPSPVTRIVHGSEKSDQGIKTIETADLSVSSELFASDPGAKKAPSGRQGGWVEGGGKRGKLRSGGGGVPADADDLSISATTTDHLSKDTTYKANKPLQSRSIIGDIHVGKLGAGTSVRADEPAEATRLANVRKFQREWKVKESTRAKKPEDSPPEGDLKTDRIQPVIPKKKSIGNDSGKEVKFAEMNDSESMEEVDEQTLLVHVGDKVAVAARRSHPIVAAPAPGSDKPDDISGKIKSAEIQRPAKVREFQKDWKVVGSDKTTKAMFTIFKAKYQDGDWNCNPDALNNLLSQIRAYSKERIKETMHQEVVDVGSDQLSILKPSFIYMTGEKDFSFTDREVDNIRKYLLTGGAIWADNAAPGKGTPFDLAFRREMKRVLPDRNFEELPSNHDIYNMYFDSLSLPKEANVNQSPIEKIDIGGEPVVLYTLNGYGSLWDRYALNSNGHIEVMSGKTDMDRGIPAGTKLSDTLVNNAYKMGINATVHLLTRMAQVIPPITVTPETNTPPAPEPAVSNIPPVTVPVCRAIGVNQFVSTAAELFSTFSIDVDTASYTLCRNYLLRGRFPSPEAVRTEEFVNFFDYDYTPPNGQTFAVYSDCGPSAFGRGMALLKIGVKGRRLGREEKRAAVLTLLIDTSGSMATPDRIELVKNSLSRMLERLDPADKVAIVQYDSHARLLLEHTPASEKKRILDVIENLQTSGSTALEEGMREAYSTAARGFNSAACNRVLLLSDGMANLGTTTAEEILKSVADYRKQGITLSVFGFGLGAYNDEMLETLANKGDGAYSFIDSEAEAQRVLVDDLAATINLIARDVKIQVEFNPKRIKQYRQLGYENRQLKKEQFRDDSVDAGEIGSGQSVTALYELELQGDPHAPLGMVRVRCRNDLTGQIEEIEQPLAPPAGTIPFEGMDVRFRLAAAAAEFSEILRGSPFASGSQFEDVARVLRPVALELSLDNRIQEFLRMTEMGLKPRFQEPEVE